MTPGVVVVVVWWCGGFFTDNNTTPTKVVLSCFGLLVGLWQLLSFYSLATPFPRCEMIYLILALFAHQ
jgi:hypothetical protein